MPYPGFTEEESRILDTSTDPQVQRLLKARTGQPIGTPIGHYGDVLAGAFTAEEQPLLLNALQQYQQRAQLDQSQAAAGLQGPYADVSKTMLGLAQKLSTPQLQPRVASMGGQAPRATLPPYTGQPGYDPTGVTFTTKAPKPVTPTVPREIPPEIRALQQALDAMQSREAQLGERRRTIDTAFGTTGGTTPFTPTESLFSAQNLADRSTPEQVFNATFHQRYAQLTGQDAANLPTKDLAQRIIGAWHRGDAETVQEDLAFLRTRVSTASRVSSPRTKAAIHQDEDAMYRDLAGRVDIADVFGVNPGKYGLTNEQLLRGILSPQSVQEMIERLDAGEDPSVWLEQARLKRDLAALQKASAA